MQPLISDDLYDRLAIRRREMIEAGIGSPAQVFVPVGAPSPDGRLRMPRILYVGIATRGYGEPELASRAASARCNAGIVADEELGRRSAFWRFIRTVLSEVADGCGAKASDAQPERTIGYSNLAKIGDVARDTFPAGFIDAQADLCVEALRAEIAAFRPTVTLLVTANHGQEQTVEAAFGAEDFRGSVPADNEVSFKLHPDAGLVLWTNHPRNAGKAGSLDSIRRFVTAAILGHWRGEPLPPCRASSTA